MSKSILVIDTPDNCVKCEFSASRLGGNGRCTLNKDCSNVIPDERRPDWCPLKELPDKKSENIKDVGLISSTRNEGWNTCIDEILKEVFEHPIPYNGDNIGGRD